VGKGGKTHKGISCITRYHHASIGLRRCLKCFGGISSRQGGVFGGGSLGETQGTGGTESTATGPEEVVLGAVVIDGLEET